MIARNFLHSTNQTKYNTISYNMIQAKLLLKSSLCLYIFCDWKFMKLTPSPRRTDTRTNERTWFWNLTPLWIWECVVALSDSLLHTRRHGGATVRVKWGISAYSGEIFVSSITYKIGLTFLTVYYIFLYFAIVTENWTLKIRFKFISWNRIIIRRLLHRQLC